MQTIPKRLAPFEKMLQSDLKAKILGYMTHDHIQPTYAEYLSLNESLQTGDIAMDKVMSWVMQNPREHRKYFETALHQGLEKLPHQITELTEFFNLVEQKPDWYDQQKIDDSLQFTYKLGTNNSFILRDLSLMTGYLYPGFNQPLILTGALSQQASKRLAETSKWWMDITEPHAFERFNAGFTSTIYVRFIHSLVRFQLNKSEKWDAETWGTPINQYDQAMTNIAFSGVVLIGIRALGIFPNKREVDSFLHFWKYTGWLMGIHEKWLIDKESESWKLLYWLRFTHPDADESSISLGSSLSKEPFERRYRYLRPLQQKLAYKQHLELTQFFIGRKQMKKLGLKAQSASWFAYYLFAKNSLLYTGAKRFKVLDNFLLKNGREMQKIGLELYKEQAKQLASMH
ncbi:oxygenase MpaB family protein [Acinetobacter sp. P8-3-8]|uniref:oxygenase MpaB family protein n=1 Tax=Acinetobacter sp. P8-3-8 TaxID=1029823 RepID=UPI00024853C0|nr:oxygenase MpaB family protein [Acinetobacter sp. P8-3-8]